MYLVSNVENKKKMEDSLQHAILDVSEKGMY